MFSHNIWFVIFYHVVINNNYQNNKENLFCYKGTIEKLFAIFTREMLERHSKEQKGGELTIVENWPLTFATLICFNLRPFFDTLEVFIRNNRNFLQERNSHSHNSVWWRWRFLLFKRTFSFKWTYLRHGTYSMAIRKMFSPNLRFCFVLETHGFTMLGELKI